MNITEMHELFRQLAQQMGMQNVFAIRPEQIDLLLNTSISDTVNQIIIQYLGKDRDSNIEDDRLGLINALRTLHRTENVNFPIMKKSDGSEYEGITDTALDFKWNELNEDAIFTQEKSNIISGTPLTYTSLAINYIRCKVNNHGWQSDDNSPSPLVVEGIYVPVVDKSNKFITKDFRVRLVENLYLPNIINDEITKPKYTSPVSVIDNGKIVIHFGKLKSAGLFDKDLSPYILKVSYIKVPDKVNSISETKVNCDLPTYLHENIVKQAVELWKQSVYKQAQQSNQ